MSGKMRLDAVYDEIEEVIENIMNATNATIADAMDRGDLDAAALAFRRRSEVMEIRAAYMNVLAGLSRLHADMIGEMATDDAPGPRTRRVPKI